MAATTKRRPASGVISPRKSRPLEKRLVMTQ